MRKERRKYFVVVAKSAISFILHPLFIFTTKVFFHLSALIIAHKSIMGGKPLGVGALLCLLYLSVVNKSEIQIS